MHEFLEFYIDGRWVSPSRCRNIDLVDSNSTLFVLFRVGTYAGCLCWATKRVRE